MLIGARRLTVGEPSLMDLERLRGRRLLPVANPMTGAQLLMLGPHRHRAVGPKQHRPQLETPRANGGKQPTPRQPEEVNRALDPAAQNRRMTGELAPILGLRLAAHADGQHKQVPTERLPTVSSRLMIGVFRHRQRPLWPL